MTTKQQAEEVLEAYVKDQLARNKDMMEGSVCMCEDCIYEFTRTLPTPSSATVNGDDRQQLIELLKEDLDGLFEGGFAEYDDLVKHIRSAITALSNGSEEVKLEARKLDMAQLEKVILHQQEKSNRELIEYIKQNQ